MQFNRRFVSSRAAVVPGLNSLPKELLVLRDSEATRGLPKLLRLLVVMALEVLLRGLIIALALRRSALIQGLGLGLLLI